MQGFAKGEYISFGRRIGRIAGNGLEAQKAGDEKDMSGSPLGHVAAEKMVSSVTVVMLSWIMFAVCSIGVSRKSPCKPNPALFTKMSIVTDLASRVLFKRLAAPARPD